MNERAWINRNWHVKHAMVFLNAYNFKLYLTNKNKT